MRQRFETCRRGGADVFAGRVGCGRHVLSFLLTLLWAAGAASAAPTQAAGAGEHLWVVRSDADGSTVRVLHGGPGEPWEGDGVLRRVTDLTGRLQPEAGVAARGDRLWLVFDGGSVTMIEQVPQAERQEAMFRTQSVARLPAGRRARALVAGDTALWALVAIVGDGASQTEPGGEELLCLSQNQWTQAALPAAWPADVQRVTLLLGASQSRPTLLATAKSADGWRLQQFDPLPDENETEWTREDYELSGALPVQVALVQGQVVIGRDAEGGGDELSIELETLRRGRVAELGVLPLGVGREQWWQLVGLAQCVGALMIDERDDVAYAAMDLQGRVTQPRQVLRQVDQPVTWRQPDLIVLTGSLVIVAALFFLVFSRRQGRPQVQRPRAGVRLGPLSSRLLAGLIDFVPCVVGVSVFSTDDVRTILEHWPGRSGSWEAMGPAAAAIGLYVLHTGLTELFTGRTLGKAITRLRVVNLQGGPPHVWQIATRNVSKALELIALPLLIMPAVSPLWQRLGDVVANTLVVMADRRRPASSTEEEDR